MAGLSINAHARRWQPALSPALFRFAGDGAHSAKIRETSAREAGKGLSTSAEMTQDGRRAVASSGALTCRRPVRSMRRLVSALALLLLALLAVGAFRAASRRAPGAGPTIIEASVGGAQFSYRLAFARDGTTRMGGDVDHLAFLVVFPDFSPAPPASADPKIRAAQEQDENRVFILVAPKDETIDPAARPSRLYARFLEGEVFGAPAGLMMRRFEAGSPYELEQLYLAPPDGASFFARCPKPEAGFMGAAPCLWALRRGALDVELRFSPALLEHWERLAEGTLAFLRSVEARAQ
jgi:hypothetical protein